MAESPTTPLPHNNGSSLLVDTGSTPPTLAARTKVKGWTVWEPLDDDGGGGGMHEVIAADAAGACVILRVPPDAATAERMRAEVEIAQQHPHKSIVQSVGVVEHDNWPVQVIEHVDGVRLDTLLLLGGPLAPEAACRIGWQIGVALAELHGRQPVVHHGALSADRIVIDVEGNARLRDVGRLMPAQALTRMSPERRSGTPTPSGPDDVYALGLIVAEAALGRSLDLGETGVLDHRDLDGLLSERVVNALAALLVPEQQRLQNAAAAARVFLEGEYSFGDGQRGLKAAVDRARRSLKAQREEEDPNTAKLDSGEADGFDVHGPVTTPNGVKALAAADAELEVTSPNLRKKNAPTVTAAPVVAAAEPQPALTMPPTEDDLQLPAAQLGALTAAAAASAAKTLAARNMKEAAEAPRLGAPADGPLAAPLAPNARAPKSLAEQKAAQVQAQKAKAQQQPHEPPLEEASSMAPAPAPAKSGNGKDVGLFFAFSAMLGVGVAAPALFALVQVMSFGNDLQAEMKKAELEDSAAFAVNPSSGGDDDKAAAALFGALADAAKEPKAADDDDAAAPTDADKAAAAAFFGALADAAKDPKAGAVAAAAPTDDDKAAAAFFGALADAAKDPKASGAAPTDDDKAAAALLGALADAAKDPAAAADAADAAPSDDDQGFLAGLWHSIKVSVGLEPSAEDLQKADDAAKALEAAFAGAAKPADAAPAPAFATSASARGGALRPTTAAAAFSPPRSVNGRGAPAGLDRAQQRAAAAAAAAQAKAEKAEQARLDRAARAETAREKAEQARLDKAARADAARQRAEEAKAAKAAAAAEKARTDAAARAAAPAAKRVRLTVAVDEPSRRQAQAELAKCNVAKNTVGVVHVVVPAGAVKVSSEPHNGCVDKTMAKAFYGAFADDEPYELNVE